MFLLAFVPSISAMPQFSASSVPAVLPSDAVLNTLEQSIPTAIALEASDEDGECEEYEDDDESIPGFQATKSATSGATLTAFATGTVTATVPATAPVPAAGFAGQTGIQMPPMTRSQMEKVNSLVSAGGVSRLTGLVALTYVLLV
ncbi:hypothetical protein BJ741DRAFT_637779 [Chytriomyces cf. hyalinus JEL632]|nr:hypothetical protein BJ741DRAFT_637779 [Chytriomyces cf. hyalinus JEL632]